MAYLKWSKEDIAAQMNLSLDVLQEILDCKRPVTPELAQLFESKTQFGYSAAMLLRTQADYDRMMAERKGKSKNRWSNFRKIAATFC
ncbi:MAG: addiction module antidote protein, HigA family [Candidatus Symbiothrix sp.]|jgi:plasmid maintenance system antidote protein VapI|nr:addiction module antidote protein, HigA family [Candidatus Symbiothrix sp.]